MTASLLLFLHLAAVIPSQLLVDLRKPLFHLTGLAGDFHQRLIDPIDLIVDAAVDGISCIQRSLTQPGKLLVQVLQLLGQDLLLLSLKHTKALQLLLKLDLQVLLVLYRLLLRNGIPALALQLSDLGTGLSVQLPVLLAGLLIAFLQLLALLRLL